MMSFDKVIDGIVVGACPTCQQDVKRLQQFGMTAVLTLQSDQDLAARQVDWTIMRQFYLQYGLVVRRVPILDFDDRDLTDRLPVAVQTLQTMIDAGCQVYVHCTAGMQRAPSVVICYLAWHQQLSLRQSIQLVLANHACDPPLAVLESVDGRYRRRITIRPSE